MILLAIQRRRRLFGLTILFVVLLANAIAMLTPTNYTAFAEIVLDPGLITNGSEDALADAEAWLRSPEAALSVARSVERPTVAHLIAPDDIWSVIRGRLMNEVAPPPGSPEAEAILVRRLHSHLSTKRVPRSYALDIGFSDTNPRFAAALTNEFAARLVARPHGTDPLGAGMRIISEASVDVSKDGPAAWLVLTASALAGIASGVIAVAVSERRFSGFTSGSDIQSRLNLYHLGSVPSLHSVLPDSASPTDAIVEAPFSGYAEAFRSILVAVRQASGKDAKVFAITSALPGEGKSTTAACLARSAALAGETVVVVDCDSRRSGASAALAGDRRGPGLVNLLRGSCDLDDALVHDAQSGAWILPCSEKGEDLPILLDGGALPELIAILRTRFDRVIIDTAPILAMATTRSVLPLVDAVIMVVRWRATPLHAVKTALGMMPSEYTSWSGVVLTQIDMRKQARYGQGDASAYYQQSSKYYS